MLASNALQRHDFRDRLGTVLDGRFRLEAFLGSGGSGAVFLARCLDASAPHPSRVAVKMFHPEVLSLGVSDHSRQAVFLREARVARLIAHPGAIRVYDARIADDGSAYLVLEYLQGKSLHDALDGWSDLVVEEVVRATRKVLEVLVAAHSRGVVHCDIKPENIFVQDNGRVRLLDFGVARIVGDSARSGTAGTRAFMAPEQARGDWADVDDRSDLFSLGATFFAMVTGRPFSLDEPLLFPAEVPESIANVMRQALAENPRDRWVDAAAMLEALREGEAAAGMPRSSRTFRAATPVPTEEELLAFRMEVPHYRFSLADLTTPLPPSAESHVRTIARDDALAHRRRAWTWAVVAVVIASVLGAALALAVPSSPLRAHSDSAKARRAKPVAAQPVTAATAP